MRSRFTRRLVAVATAAALAGASLPAHAQDFINILTGGTSGVYYPLGVAISKVFTDKIKGSRPSVQATKASVENLNLLQEGKGEIAFTLGDSLALAVKGDAEAGFPAPLDKLRTIAAIYPNTIQIVASQDSDIKTLADLKGKRVSVGAPNSGTEVMANRILEAAGLGEGDITRDRLGASESVGAIKDKKIDAFFWAGGIPTPAVLDLANTPGVKIKLVPHDDVLDKLTAKFGPLYIKLAIPKDSYPGVTADAPGIGVSNLLVASEKMDADLVYAIVKAIHENKAQLDQVHPEAKNVKLETAAQGSSVPFHPGAIKYYQEKGVWKG